MKIFFTFIYFCLFTNFSNMNAAEFPFHSTSDDVTTHSCITATLDQIYLTKEGMFVQIDREFIPIEALFFDGIGQYRCDFHNRLKDQKTCPHCGNVYDRLQYKSCPSPTCPSRCPGPKN